jgi:hypothetical protein
MLYAHHFNSVFAILISSNVKEKKNSQKCSAVNDKKQIFFFIPYQLFK